ncbi:MAG: hypothetical protein ACKVZ0_22565 [Gemmatimonadales bacterium]
MNSDVWTFFGVMMSLLSVGLLGYAGFTLISGLQRRLNRSPLPGLNPDEVEALRAQLEENEHLRERLGELEERVDFAERLLAQRQEAPRIGGGES